MRVYRLSVEPDLDAASAGARAAVQLNTPLAAESGVLRVYTLAADTVVLGRFHLQPAGHGVALTRRCSGGRVVPGGAGFVGMSLALPHRAALVADDPSALSPEQVMNRCVRGLLEGLRALGADAFYPGRDLVTVGGLPLAVIGFDVAPGGVTLFEAAVAVGRDLSVLPTLLDRADPEGVVSAPLWLPTDVTSVAARVGRTPSLVQFAEVVAAAYHDLYRIHFETGVLSAQASPVSGAPRARVPRPELDRRARTTTMLGCVEAHCRLDGSGRIADVQITGDFLASGVSVERLERRLIGTPATAGAVHGQVVEAFAGAEDFLLGLERRDLTETILRAVA